MTHKMTEMKGCKRTMKEDVGQQKLKKKDRRQPMKQLKGTRPVDHRRRQQGTSHLQQGRHNGPGSDSNSHMAQLTRGLGFSDGESA